MYQIIDVYGVLRPNNLLGVRVAQLEEAGTVNHSVGRLSHSCVKLTKSLQQASNPKVAESFGSRLKLGGPMYHNNIVGLVKDPHLPVTHCASVKTTRCCRLRPVTLCIPSDYTYSSRSGRYWELIPFYHLPFLLDPGSIAKMQS